MCPLFRGSTVYKEEDNLSIVTELIHLNHISHNYV